MDTAARNHPLPDADAFLQTDPPDFGSAWRYELVHGAIVAHGAPSPDHGVILGNLAGEPHAGCFSFSPVATNGALPVFGMRRCALPAPVHVGSSDEPVARSLALSPRHC